MNQPWLCGVRCPVISGPCSMFNSINLKSTVPGDCKSNHSVSPTCVISKWIAISRTSSKYDFADLESTVPGKPEQWPYRDSSPVSQKMIISTIFWVQFHQHKDFCVPGNIINCRVSFPVALTNGHFMIISWVELYWLKRLCVLGDLNNEYAVSYPVSLTNSHFKTIFQVKIYQLPVPGNLSSNCVESPPQVLLKNGLPFHDISQVYTYQLKEFCVLGDPNHQCAESLPWYYQWSHF